MRRFLEQLLTYYNFACRYPCPGDDIGQLWAERERIHKALRQWQGDESGAVASSPAPSAENARPLSSPRHVVVG
jgi:hypothetical protein